eukprot:1044569-Pyramimonas_sp.AAC.1
MPRRRSASIPVLLCITLCVYQANITTKAIAAVPTMRSIRSTTPAALHETRPRGGRQTASWRKSRLRSARTQAGLCRSYRRWS